MVASPVENNSIVMLKLDKPVQMSDFARSICVDQSELSIHSSDQSEQRCVGLGWNNRTGELSVARLSSADDEECEAEGAGLSNSLCMTAGDSLVTAEHSCVSEMMAGHGLMCQDAAGVWQLAGVAAWRRGCGEVGQRPRLYESVAATSAWIENVIKLDSVKKQEQVPRRRLG